MNTPADVPAAYKSEFQENYNKITHNTNRLMLFASDQKIEHLNNDFYGDFIHPDANNPVHIFNIAAQGKIGALATQLGLIARYGHNFKNVNYIVKLNSKTNLIPTKSKDPVSPLLWSVKDVVNFKKDSGLSICGVGYTVYLGSEYESEMLHNAAQIVYQAHQNGLVAMLWVYPRGMHINTQASLSATPGFAGVANALGADFVKIKAPEVSEDINLETLKTATIAAGNTKVLCAGGEPEETNIFLHKLHEQITLGGTSGSATGRNIFQRSLRDAVAFTNAISAIVYENKNFHEAMDVYNKLIK